MADVLAARIAARSRASAASCCSCNRIANASAGSEGDLWKASGDWSGFLGDESSCCTGGDRPSAAPIIRPSTILVSAGNGGVTDPLAKPKCNGGGESVLTSAGRAGTLATSAGAGATAFFGVLTLPAFFGVPRGDWCGELLLLRDAESVSVDLVFAVALFP